MRYAITLAPANFDTTEQLCMPVQLVEAVAFACPARRYLQRMPCNLPVVTGAKDPRVLEEIYTA